jgi:hypothetical protein
MEYVIVKTMTAEDIIGKLKLADDKELVLIDPCYVNIKLRMGGAIHFGMMRVTLLGDKHEIKLPIEKVLTFYAASDNVSKYYNKVVSAYDEYYDEQFAQLLDDRLQYEGYKEDEDEEETEMIKTYMEKLLQSNTSIH